MGNLNRGLIAVGMFLFFGFLFIPENPSFIRIGLIAFSGCCFAGAFILLNK